MSRLTASPFHKPAPFVFPKEPISPPETLASSVYPQAGLPPTSNEAPHEESAVNVSPEASSQSRIRRPSISYQNSGLRDPPTRPVHRSYRFFVVVVPPPCLIQEHGHLGHTLGSGPSHRLSQGIIVPLFPTVYGQLTAIAKEFNFPSTTGLCLYLHWNENGISMTPRISDELWHTLWSHLFEIPSTPRGLPIAGKIEFDVDFQQARWYPSWLSTFTRDHLERPSVYFPSNAPSATHVHGESRASSSPESDNPGNAPSHLRGTSSNLRHVPKKLSLVDRFEFPSSRPASRASVVESLKLPDQGPPVAKALSPIIQEEEPKSAREKLEDRVKYWRASTVISPQTQPHPLGEDTSSPVEVEMNLEEFTWSISSVGPDDYDTVFQWAPSVRLPSPDIARRVLDDCPLTPSTATTWGAPLSYPPSPLSNYRPPSLDLGFRSIFSPPLTPATATSWGPLSPAMSTLHWYQEVSRPASVHLADRGEFSRPVTPSTATTWGAPVSYPPTPTTPEHVHTPDAAQRCFDDAQENGIKAAQYSHSHRVLPWQFVWPYFRPREAGPESRGEVMQGSGYPYFSIYPPVYPHFELYPIAAAARTQDDSQSTSPVRVTLNTQYPALRIYVPVYPHNLDVIYPEVQQEGKSFTPAFVTTSQYPFFDLYPTVPKTTQVAPAVPSSCTNCSYPAFNLYPAVYPHFDFYPAVERASASVKMVDPFYGTYPNFVIYPLAYPHFDLYPGKATEVLKEADVELGEVKVTLSGQYPSFNFYPPVYPHFNIYPVPESVAKQEPVNELSTGVYPYLIIYPPVTGRNVNNFPKGDTEGLNNTVQSDSYPVIRPYPPVYPHFDLYPSTMPRAAVSKTSEHLVLLPGATAYPSFNLYPAVYPHFSLYPSVAGEVCATEQQERSALYIPSYPFLQIYSPVYPHISIYPAIAVSNIAQGNTSAAPVPQPKFVPSGSRKSHHELHQEIFSNGPVPTPSGPGIRPGIDLRPLSVSPRQTRRIVATRSPTGPALHRPAVPPALPSPSRRLPTPPSNNDIRSPNVLEQMAGYMAQISPTRRRSATSHPSATAGAASVVSPLCQMPLPKLAEDSMDPVVSPLVPGTMSSGLSRARSLGNGGNTFTVKPRIRDSYMVRRSHGL